MDEQKLDDQDPDWAWKFGQRRYAARRRGTAKLTASQIDDRLNLLGCDHVLRDEIVERLARLEAIERKP